MTHYFLPALSNKYFFDLSTKLVLEVHEQYVKMTRVYDSKVPNSFMVDKSFDDCLNCKICQQSHPLVNDTLLLHISDKHSPSGIHGLVNSNQCIST